MVWTQGLNKLYGLESDTLEGRLLDWKDRLHRDDVAQLLAMLRSLAHQQHGTADYEFRCVLPNDELRWLNGRAMFQRDERGRPHVLGINMDITERKQVEADLRQRTEELARSNEDLQRFAYTASHDIQEPLRGISAYTELLARKYMPGDAQADQYVKFIRDGVNRIRTLVQDLLEYCRVANEGAVPDHSVSFDAVLNEALRNLRASVEESGAKINSSGLPTIAADEHQMVQLLQNLIGNAIKYRTPERAPEVTISAEYADRCWTFCVADNGIGIDMAHAQRIFGVFQRLHTNEQYPGTRIGLAICERIVTRHGGKIWVQSVPGHGSKFLFTLPFTGARADPCV